MTLGGRHSARERAYLYIDGGCLRATVSAINQGLFGNKTEYRPYVSALAHGSLIRKDFYDKIFYYDAVSGRDHNEDRAVYEARVKPEHEEFEKIQALDRVHIALGNMVGPNKRQKGVDVRLAVDMMTDAFRGNASRLTLFAGDADFVPLVKALVKEGMHVTLWHPPQANSDLKNSADSTRLFEFKQDYPAFTKDGVTSGFQPYYGGYSTVSLANEGVTKISQFEGRRLAGKWVEDTLVVYRYIGGNEWQILGVKAPKASIEVAMKAFDEIHGWDIACLGQNWIDVQGA